MTKTSRSSTVASEDSFHKHYSAIWGAERWQNSLYPALAKPTRQCILVNRFVADSISAEPEAQIADLKQLPLPIVQQHSQIRALVSNEDNSPNGQVMSNIPAPHLAAPPGKQQRLMTHWNLDAASLLAVHVLNVQPHEKVLDLCAAPGGKSIALAQRIWPEFHTNVLEGLPMLNLGHLTSNELDRPRCKRLTENLRAYLPAELYDSKSVAVHQVDGTDTMAHRKLSMGGAGYDKVLVDAPCSSERHIIHAHNSAQAGSRVAPEMSTWRPASSKRLAESQVALLMTGIRAAKIGGSIVYATCSITPAENDGVIEKVLATVDKESKKGAKWTIRTGFNSGAGNLELERALEKDWAEPTKYGWMVLPDHASGGRWGPLFFVVLTKTALTGS